MLMIDVGILSIREEMLPWPSFVLATPFPRMRSHILSALSFPTLNATFPEGCIAIELIRPL